MAQVIPISEDVDPQLLGLARSMAADMEAGRRPFKKGIVLDGGGFIVFQKIGERVRAIVSSTFGVVGYYSKSGDPGNRATAEVDSLALSWGSTGNMTILQTLPGAVGQKANNISRNGRFIVGTANMGGSYQAIMWAAGNVKVIEGLTSAAWVSNSGNIIVGLSNGGITGKITNGVFDLLPSDLYLSISNPVNQVSDDGSIIVGYRPPEDNPIVYQSGVLDDLPTDSSGFSAFAISPDGSVIVGQSAMWVNREFSPLEGVGYGASNNGDSIILYRSPNSFVKTNTSEIKLDALQAGDNVAAQNISSSGKIIAGFFSRESGTKEGPIMWVNSKPYDLSGDLGLAGNGGFRTTGVSG